MRELEDVKLQVSMVLIASVQVPGVLRYEQAYDDVMATVLLLNRAAPGDQLELLQTIRKHLKTMELLGDFMKPAYDAIDKMEAVL